VSKGDKKNSMFLFELKETVVSSFYQKSGHSLFSGSVSGDFKHLCSCFVKKVDIGVFLSIFYALLCTMFTKQQKSEHSYDAVR